MSGVGDQLDLDVRKSSAAHLVTLAPRTTPASEDDRFGGSFSSARVVLGGLTR
jgi:hypothetical protein